MPAWSRNSAAGPASSRHAQAAAPFRFFTADDVAFIEAAVERLIPADDYGPGARHAGVAVYIDRCLLGAWDSSDRLYRNRLWKAGGRIGDFTLPDTPGVLFRSALRGIEDDLDARPELRRLSFGLRSRVRLSARRRFALLPAPSQDAWLRGLQTDERLLENIPSGLFLEFLFALTVEAFFGDPAFSGNEDTVARQLDAHRNTTWPDREHGVPFAIPGPFT